MWWWSGDWLWRGRRWQATASLNMRFWLVGAAVPRRFAHGAWEVQGYLGPLRLCAEWGAEGAQG